MTKELELPERFDRMNAVMELYMRGINPTEIARKLDYRRVEVIEHIEEWRKLAQNNDDLQLMAKEAVLGATQHYNNLIRELWEVVEEAADHDLKVKTTALKTIAELEEKRIGFLQKAGLLDEAGLGDEMAEVEEQIEGIKQLFGEVAKKYPETANMILQGLSRIFNRPIGVVVE